MNTAVPSGTASTYFVFKPKSNGKTGDISFRYDDKLPVVPKVHCASWTKKDNDALLSVVGSISANKIDWQTVSNLLRENFKFNASPMECLMQYRNSVSPTIKKCDWSKEEVDKLTELAAYYNEHEWCAIAEELGTNRTPMQCLQYYQRNLNHRLIRSNNIWTEEEEKQLKQSIEVYGSSDWSNVASDLPGRTPTQCFNRYRRSSLCQGDVITGHWLEEEEKLLYFACVAMHAPQSSSFKKSPEQLSLLLNDNIVSGSNNSSSDNGRKSKKRPISILQESTKCYILLLLALFTIVSDGTEPDGLIEMVAGTDSSETKSAGKFKGWTAIAQLIPGK